MSANDLWGHYVRHFSFSQLGWLFDAFQQRAAEDDTLSTKDELAEIVDEWLVHQWPNVLHRPSVDDGLLIKSLEGPPLRRFPLDFVNFISVLHLYVDLHIETEVHAGFDQENLISLEELYEMHNPLNADGLKACALFAVLDELGIAFHSKEDRQWYIDTVTKFDRDSSGTINFVELCQIIRKVINMEEEKERKRQFDLIKQSGLPYHEVEDWNALFQSRDSGGKGELQLSEVKELISGLGIPWDKEASETVRTWVDKGDDNANGSIDFGEFCIIISKMWSANFKDIRGAARNSLVKDASVSLKTVHNTYVTAAQDGKLIANTAEPEEAEIFIMKRFPSGNISLQTSKGDNIVVREFDVQACKENGTQFKVTILEDERIILNASTTLGGPLFVTLDGVLAISDGNPADIPFTIFSVTSHDDLNKKFWSKHLPKKGKSKAEIIEARQKAKSKSPRPNASLCTTVAETINSVDNALEAKKLSARGDAQ